MYKTIAIEIFNQQGDSDQLNSTNKSNETPQKIIPKDIKSPKQLDSQPVKFIAN